MTINLFDKITEISIKINNEKNIIILNELCKEKNELLRMWGEIEYNKWLKGGE